MSPVLVGQRIRRLRHVAGIGQADFAEMVGIASGSVSKLENGRMPLSQELLSKVAASLSCTPDFLIHAGRTSSDDTPLASGVRGRSETDRRPGSRRLHHRDGSHRWTKAQADS